MISRLTQQQVPQMMVKSAGEVRRLVSKAIVRRSIFGVAFFVCIIAATYWCFIASDRYVSEARIIIQRTDLGGGQNLDIGTLLTGSTGGGNRVDQLLLRDHLLSLDMLKKLDAKLDLRTHYSNAKHDRITRMGARTTPQEKFHAYYLSRIDIEYDDYAGVLTIKAQGFTPDTAHAITSMLVEEGERTMNALANSLALEQVSFVEKQVTQLAARVQQARQDLIAFQNEKGMASPQATAENMAATINRLDAQRSDLQARRNAMLGYLSAKAPGIIELNLQIGAINKQMETEQARLTAPGGKTLNSTVEQYQRLEMAAEFAQDTYKTALVALEKGRIEATRTIKKVSVLQEPTFPEYAQRPARLYNLAVFILVTLLVAGIVQMLAAIIRDHKE